ncbi:MAG: Uma2 family endonuclease [Gemmataceae bacterium]|nr:Uma2 family endonuclease [Gemmataceae bacterium]MDW8265075.1 Uma2 family endonuclease [Gemmataceae bacterium]
MPDPVLLTPGTVESAAPPANETTARAEPAYVTLARRILETPDIHAKFPLLVELTRILPDSDDKPMETPWHRYCMMLLIDALATHWESRSDVYIGGNNFVYFSMQQIMSEDFLGPDFFCVTHGVDRLKPRRFWAVWDEGGRYPDLIIELTSPATARRDRVEKKALYQNIFRTPEYFCFDPDTQRLEGWRLHGDQYVDIPADARGWMWSEQVQLWLGTWTGSYFGMPATFLRFYDAAGQVVPTQGEAARSQADAERQRAEEQRQRAEAEYQRAEEQRQRAEAEHQRAEEQRQRAEAERQRAEAERQRAEAERQRAEEAERRAAAERQRAEAFEAELARLKALLAQRSSEGVEASDET